MIVKAESWASRGMHVTGAAVRTDHEVIHPSCRDKQ
jgi:hypothetical protein